jgi:predicted ATPase
LYCQVCDFVEYELQGLMDDVMYIGPLREAPRRIYELSAETPEEVGVRGECAPELVYHWRNDAAKTEQLTRWLRTFEFGDRLVARARGTDAFSLHTSSGSRLTSIADAGIGFSQALPLIVQAIAASPYSWLVVEEPELHLNPRLQARIGNLLAWLVDKGVGVIVETHSDHLLLRLRRLIAQGDLRTDDVGLYYVDRPKGTSRVRSIPIRSDGSIDPKRWPPGFFGDALADAMALAEAQLELTVNAD